MCVCVWVPPLRGSTGVVSCKGGWGRVVAAAGGSLLWLWRGGKMAAAARPGWLARWPRDAPHTHWLSSTQSPHWLLPPLPCPRCSPPDLPAAAAVPAAAAAIAVARVSLHLHPRSLLYSSHYFKLLHAVICVLHTFSHYFLNLHLPFFLSKTSLLLHLHTMQYHCSQFPHILFYSTLLCCLQVMFEVPN